MHDSVKAMDSRSPLPCLFGREHAVAAHRDSLRPVGAPPLHQIDPDPGGMDPHPEAWQGPVPAGHLLVPCRQAIYYMATRLDGAARSKAFLGRRSRAGGSQGATDPGWIHIDRTCGNTRNLVTLSRIRVFLHVIGIPVALCHRSTAEALLDAVKRAPWSVVAEEAVSRRSDLTIPGARCA